MNTHVQRRPVTAALLGVWVLFIAGQTVYGQAGQLMTPISGADGVFDTVQIDGEVVYRSAGTPGTYERYMYFATDAVVQAATAYVEVSYLDVGYGTLGLQYNATTGDYEIATPRRGSYVQDTQGWRTAVFELPNAEFRNAQNLGADLRLYSEPSLQKHIRSATVSLEPPSSLLSGDLFTPAPSFEMDNHIVSTTVFHWYVPHGGQLSGPWRPIEGRENWSGEPDWWTYQIKQMMRANIDIIYVHYFPGLHEQRINLFQALSELRAEGWDVPKVAAWLDPLITWNEQPKIDLNTEAGKDELASHYIRIFEQYFSVNTDEHAEDYLAQIDGRPVLNTWHVHLSMDNVASLTREDLESRLQAALAAEHPIFNNGIYMVTTALNPPFFTFADERVPQFEINDYYVEHAYNGLKTVQLKGGYWDQNIRTPGDFLPRQGGVPYTQAWEQVDETVDRVYVESWNEYDEGTGIYAADTGTPFILPGSSNTNTDTWSSTNDPFEYVKTTAEGADGWNDTPAHDAKMLAHSFPETMVAGHTVEATITVRNEGDARWTGQEGYGLEPVNQDAARFSDRVLIDDMEDDIPTFGGIFRGRPKTFSVTLTAPDTPGMYDLRWGMQRGEEASFGEELAVSIGVVANAAPTIADALPDVTLSGDGEHVVEDLSAFFTDPDGDALTFSATSSDESVATATISGSMLTVTPLARGEATITVTAADSYGGAAAVEFEVAVAANAAPTINAALPDTSLTAGAGTITQDLNAVFSDPDGDPLTFAAASSDDAVAEATVTGSTLTVTPVSVGDATITVTADDGFGGTTEATFDVTVLTGVSTDPVQAGLPTVFALLPNYPNPFNPSTAIRYALPHASHVRLAVHDVLGREVAMLIDAMQTAGRHEVVWQAVRMPSGVYLCRLEADGFAQTRQMLLIK